MAAKLKKNRVRRGTLPGGAKYMVEQEKRGTATATRSVATKGQLNKDAKTVVRRSYNSKGATSKSSQSEERFKVGTTPTGKGYSSESYKPFRGGKTSRTRAEIGTIVKKGKGSRFGIVVKRTDVIGGKMKSRKYIDD